MGPETTLSASALNWNPAFNAPLSKESFQNLLGTVVGYCRDSSGALTTSELLSARSINESWSHANNQNHNRAKSRSFTPPKNVGGKIYFLADRRAECIERFSIPAPLRQTRNNSSKNCFFPVLRKSCTLLAEGPYAHKNFYLLLSTYIFDILSIPRLPITFRVHKLPIIQWCTEWSTDSPHLMYPTISF